MLGQSDCESVLYMVCVRVALWASRRHDGSYGKGKEMPRCKRSVYQINNNTLLAIKENDSSHSLCSTRASLQFVYLYVGARAATDAAHTRSHRADWALSSQSAHIAYRDGAPLKFVCMIEKFAESSLAETPITIWPSYVFA